MYSYGKIESLKFSYKTIKSLIEKMEKSFPGRHFTMDGHLIGSMGECMAAFHYGIKLEEASKKDYDGAKGGIKIQIKATQRNMVMIRNMPEHLIVLQLLDNGDPVEIYNGPGNIVWNEIGNPDSHGYYHVSLKKLERLDEQVPDEKRIKDENPIRKKRSVKPKEAPCDAFLMDDPKEAYAHMKLKTIIEYGDELNGKNLYVWDEGERRLCRCNACGGYVLVQSSEYHSFTDDPDGYYTDFVPVSSEAEADRINERYDGFELESKSGIRFLCKTNGELSWSSKK